MYFDKCSNCLLRVFPLWDFKENTCGLFSFYYPDSLQGFVFKYLSAGNNISLSNTTPAHYFNVVGRTEQTEFAWGF